jgi:WD40 repeat protein
LESLTGRSFGEFVVREPLSSGGFGQVYRAEQPALAREAVIKVLHRELRGSGPVVQRFLREAQLASKLDHPYAAHIYAFGAEPDGVLWIAMELVRGTPLDRLLEAQGPIPLERFTPLLDRLCEVIHSAHEQGIVHRDLKPANVMVLARAGRLLPKLLDLGIAKHGAELAADGPAPAGDAPTTGRLTEHGASMGSPLYMAPEQWVDAALADARTDQYALGALCFEALTGKPPFTGASRVAIARAHARQSVPSLGAGFPPALDAVLARALAKKPAERFASALELGAAFRVASGVEPAVAVMPRLSEAARVAAETAAPQPIAQAVAALDAARNPHQARDAVWQLVRTATRLVGAVALAGHAHVGSGARTDPGAAEALRRLGRRGAGDADWLALATALVAPFARLRDAHPVPELVAWLTAGAPALTQLLARRASAGEHGGDALALVDAALPEIAALVDELAFFSDYPLIVPDADGGEAWMGLGRRERRRVRLRGKAPPAGQPVLIDADGAPVLALWPYVQRLAPAPGAPEQLFFLDGKGRRGARLVALPDAFEREDDALWDELGARLADPTTASGPIDAGEESPFPGLAAFTRADAARFFGRERETEAFVNRLRVTPLLAVIGPSGAGKSSFVQAGVLPALPEGWDAITVRPGSAPLATLAAKLGAQELTRDPDALGAALRARAGSVVLVVDQLEELFTLCDDADERARYADALTRAARAADDPVRVVLTLRDDFLLAAEALAPFRSRLAQSLELLTTPAAPDLRRILVEPVTRAGYDFDDPALPDEMVAAIADAPGALALLSFTASKLWELRDRRFRHLGKKAYESLGGVGGALAQHAEGTLRAMPAEEQGLVREVFRHAVTADGTRAVMSRAELEEVLGGGPHARAVIEKLVLARLLVAAEREDGGERVEITHEALLSAWPRLVEWRREDAEGAELRDQLRAAARQWDERGRPTGLLWRGDALTELRLWRARVAGAMTATEEAFADASFADAARGRRWRLGLLVASFVVLGAGVIALTFLNRSANRSAATLRDQRRDQAEEQGRSALVDLHDAPLALRYLQQAADLGEHSPAHDLLVAFASRVPASRLHKLVHPNESEAAAFSPDGTRVVTGCDDGTARIWDVASERVLVTVHHDREVQRVEWSHDGTTFLTGSFDGTAALWNASTGALQQRFSAAEAGHLIVCARLSPDEKLVATATDDDAAALWDAATGRRLATLHEAGTVGDVQVGTPCAWSADGERIAIGDVHGTTRVWRAADATLLATATGHSGQINDVDFSPDGRAIATASSDGTAAVWDAATGALIRKLRHRDRVSSARFDPTGTRVVTASNDWTAVLWDVASGDALETLAHDSSVNKAVFQPGGVQIATVSDDGGAYLWDGSTGRRESTLQGHESSIYDVEYDRTGKTLVTAGDSVFVWNAASQQPVVRLTGHTTKVSSLDLSPDGKLLASLDHTGTIWLWDWAAGVRLRAISAVRETRDARFSPDGRLIATGGGDHDVHIWDVATGREVQTITGHQDEVRRLSWSPDGTQIISASYDGTARITRVPASGPSLVLHQEPRVDYAIFTPDGANVITAGAVDVREWALSDPRAPQHVWRYVGSGVGVGGSIEVSKVSYEARSQQLLGSSAAYNVAVIWDRAGSPDRGRQLRGHRGILTDSGWSPDGTFVLTGSIDGTARLWDASSGKQVTAFDLGFDQVWSVAYSRDGRHVLTGTGSGLVLVWELPISAK